MAPFAPRRILCPIDLSPASNAVLSWAGIFAQAFESEVEVLHADWFEAPRYFTEDQLSQLKAEADRAREALTRDLELIAKKVLGPSVRFSASVLEGHAVDVIRQRLALAPPDLVVIGSHGRSGLARFLLGSVAENTVHEAQCPVLIVKGTDVPAEKKGLRSVLCPITLTKSAQMHAAVAAEIARAFDSELTVLNVVDEPSVAPASSRASLCNWIPQEIRGRCRLREEILQGDPAEQIVLLGRRENSDLIVLGAPRRRFLETTSMAQTPVRVMRQSQGPALLVSVGVPDTLQSATAARKETRQAV